MLESGHSTPSPSYHPPHYILFILHISFTTPVRKRIYRRVPLTNIFPSTINLAHVNIFCHLLKLLGWPLLEIISLLCGIVPRLRTITNLISMQTAKLLFNKRLHTSNHPPTAIRTSNHPPSDHRLNSQSMPVRQWGGVVWTGANKEVPII